MASPPLLPGAQTSIYNGIMQNDMDAQGHKIWNLDPSSVPPSGGPNPFPAVAHQWLNSYDSVSHNFTATQPNQLTDIAGFPVVSGHSGQFLTNNGTALSWGAPPNSTAGSGIINVRDFGATGNGTTDDLASIQNAIAYAVAQHGLTVYFPAGRYRISANLNIFATGVSLLGDSPYLSVIAGDPASAGNPKVDGPVITIDGAQGCVIQKLGVDGGASRVPTSAANFRSGIVVYRTNGVYLLNCLVTNCSCSGILSGTYVPGGGIAVQYCYGITIRDCLVGGVGTYGIEVFNSPRTLILGNTIANAYFSGIWLANSVNSAVQNNQIFQCAPFGYGVVASDSDHTLITGNTIQQCDIGIGIYSSTRRGRVPDSHGYVVTGNNITRNYYIGLYHAVTNGTQTNGNAFVENGQGGTNALTYTVEPGIVIDISVPANQGTGYVVGDIITGPGTTPFKAIVTHVLSGGKIAYDGLFPITMGTYATFPLNPVAVTGGTGSGAKVQYTNLLIQYKGAGYVIGQVLVSLSGSFYNPVRILVTGVDSSGGITSFLVLDGGGYYGTLPTTLSFMLDGLTDPGGDPSLPPITDPTTSIILVPGWGLRYSQFNSGGTSSGILTDGVCKACTFNSNVLSDCKSGYGIAVKSGNFSGLATYLVVTGNNIYGNHASILLSDPNSVVANNLIYPPGS